MLSRPHVELDVELPVSFVLLPGSASILILCVSDACTNEGVSTQKREKEWAVGVHAGNSPGRLAALSHQDNLAVLLNHAILIPVNPISPGSRIL